MGGNSETVGLRGAVRPPHFFFSFSKCWNGEKIERSTVVNFSGVNKCGGIARKLKFGAVLAQKKACFARGAKPESHHG